MDLTIQIVGKKWIKTIIRIFKTIFILQISRPFTDTEFEAHEVASGT